MLFLLLLSDLIYLLNYSKLQTIESSDVQLKRGEQSQETLQDSLKKPVMIWATDRTCLDGASIFEVVTPWHSYASQPRFFF